jgi:GH18 family chitinase
MSELSFQDWAASYYVKKGVPPEMMNIGMGVYGRSFTLSSPSNHDVGGYNFKLTYKLRSIRPINSIFDLKNKK